MAETAAVPENFAYIPLSSLIILLVILLTCASRRKKIEIFSAIEQSNDVKEEYAVMCFPCLKKKPDLQNFEPIEDLTNQFEYIVEKYTVRKVPLLLANTVEDIIERKEELELAKAPETQPQPIADDFVNFQLSPEVYNVQKIPPCITLASNVACPGRKAMKERPIPSDILESMSPISRPAVNNNNYVVIPTKGSLRHKDIMLTKREITNQYLNNFSSVFIDNLKDQVPKDPEQFPSLSRPYTSSYKTFPIDHSKLSKSHGTKGKKCKNQRVAYALSVADSDHKPSNSIQEELYTDSDSMQEQSTNPPNSDAQEDEGTLDEFTDKSKSLVLLKDSDSVMESLPNPFKTTIKSSESELDHNNLIEELENRTDWPSTKNVTYEDIQALDVGYEFTSCEKLGVKPKMTRIPYPIEAEKFKESLKLAFGDSGKLGKKSCSQEQGSMKSLRTIILKPPSERHAFEFYNDIQTTPSEKNSSKSVITETSFTNRENSRVELNTAGGYSTAKSNARSSVTELKTETRHEPNNTESDTVVDSVTEISKLYDLTMPLAMLRENASTEIPTSKETGVPCPMPSKSRSYQDAPGSKKDDGPEAKGKDTNPYSGKKELSKLDDHETETTCSLYSRESKTSSAVTTGVSSEVDEGKRATLRWKIVIKHHRDDDPRRNASVNIRH